MKIQFTGRTALSASPRRVADHNARRTRQVAVQPTPRLPGIANARKTIFGLTPAQQLIFRSVPASPPLSHRPRDPATKSISPVTRAQHQTAQVRSVRMLMELGCQVAAHCRTRLPFS